MQATKLGKRVRQGKRGKACVTRLSTHGFHGCLLVACAKALHIQLQLVTHYGNSATMACTAFLAPYLQYKRFKSTFSLRLTEIMCLNDITILLTVMGSISQPPIGLSNLQPPNNEHVQLSSGPAAPQNIGQHYPQLCQAPPQHPQQANTYQNPVPYPIVNANGAQYPVPTFQKPSLDEADNQPWR